MNSTGGMKAILPALPLPRRLPSTGPGRGLRDRFRTLWASFHLNIRGFRVWFAGDTGYNGIQFREIGERFGGMDLALVPIGAYAPRWFMRPQHVDPEEAVKIHMDIGARLSIGMHWATFQLSAEAVDDPRRELAHALKQRGPNVAPFITLALGEIRELATTVAASPAADLSLAQGNS